MPSPQAQLPPQPQLQSQLQMEEEVDMSMLREREQAIRKIESDIVEVNQIFKDLATMVHDQGEVIDSIEANIESSSIQIHEGTQQLIKASDYSVCFPCDRKLRARPNQPLLLATCPKEEVYDHIYSPGDSRRHHRNHLHKRQIVTFIYCCMLVMDSGVISDLCDTTMPASI